MKMMAVLRGSNLSLCVYLDREVYMHELQFEMERDLDVKPIQQIE